MRFKNSPRYLLLGFAAISAYLWKSRDLDFYIHPRYENFTLVMSIICIIIFLAANAHKTQEEVDSQTHNHMHKKARVQLNLLPIILIFAFAALFPARSLQSVTVSQRATDVQSGGGTETKPKTVFSGSSRGLSIVDWSQILTMNTSESYYQNKPAKISGFIYDARLGPDVIWIARFAVTCCAVDARPVGVPVLIEHWSGSYKQDQWLEVEGEFKTRSTLKGDQLVLVPTAVRVIQEPQNPYVN